MFSHTEMFSKGLRANPRHFHLGYVGLEAIWPRLLKLDVYSVWSTRRIEARKMGCIERPLPLRRHALGCLEPYTPMPRPVSMLLEIDIGSGFSIVLVWLDPPRCIFIRVSPFWKPEEYILC
jgi:hypothetical protein